MKEYKYIYASEIEKYKNWEIVKIIEAPSSDCTDRIIIMKEDKPIQDYIKLNEATNEQLIEELLKRLKGNKDE